MNEGTRIALIVSAIVFVAIALIVFTFIMYRVFKLKKQIKQDRVNIANEISTKEGEKRLIERTDFGESIEEIHSIIPNAIEHESVEICINSCIRNNFKNALFLGDVGPYEAITLSNKAKLVSYVLKDGFNNKIFDEIKDKISIDFNVEIINEITQKFDCIIILNNENDFSLLFKNHYQYLNEKGMIIIGNIKKNKKETKKLISEINEINYKYDMLKWHNGFIIVVK